MDTNVLLSALRSRRGASFKLLSLIDAGKFSLCVSVPLVLEYEATITKEARAIGLSLADLDAVIDSICHISEHYKVYYLWRPFLRDSKDDMVLELAVSSNTDAILTYNRVDFKGTEQFGVKVISPKDFLVQIGELT
jgi:putative PIN family toxin of toxin-antitoxin system